MKITLFVLSSICFFLFGCTEKSTRPQNEGKLINNIDRAFSDKLAEVKPDMSVPSLAPKPVVWFDDWQGTDKMPTARQKAQNLMLIADDLKSSEKFAEAENYYKKAIDADPTWGYPAYQLACNYELWNQDERAVRLFKKSVKLGFDDFPTALTDNELGHIRDLPDFTSTLVKIRKRYIASSPNMVGQPIAIRPQGEKPTKGWPMILFLHGYGDTNLSFLDLARQWAKLGFVAVPVPGSVPSRIGRYLWDMESTVPTQKNLQAIINSPLFNGLVNREKIFLLGFSQGALHAMLLTAEHSELYAGVVTLSPGGSLADRMANPSLSQSQRKARVMFIHGTQEPHAPYVRLWSRACQAAGWKFDSKTHPGGHHFPVNWEEMQPEIAKFLLK